LQPVTVLFSGKITLIFAAGMLEPRQRRLGFRPTPDGAEAKRNPMSDFRNYQTRSVPYGGRADAAIDQGLRAYMIKVYNLMGLGLLITGLAAVGTVMLATTTDPASAVATLPNGEMLTSFGYAIFASPLRWVVILAPLAAVMFLSFRVQSMSVSAAQTTFWVYAGLVGLSLSSIFLVYTAASISQTFFATAAAFGALSLYGYTTKRDLTAVGSFLIMGVFGLIIASLLNMWLQSPGLMWGISFLGVLIFATISPARRPPHRAAARPISTRACAHTCCGSTISWRSGLSSPALRHGARSVSRSRPTASLRSSAS
jgi:FtsH-binding integral membrane protein